MNIAIINHSDAKGGAARAARRLQVGLRSLGQNAVMVVKEKLFADPNVLAVSPSSPQFRLNERAFREIEKKCNSGSRGTAPAALFSFPYPGYDLSGSLFIRGMNVINLHHLRGFQSVETIARLLEMDRPLVWTLHDQAAFTGGCHYAADCRRFCVDCRDCPQLADDFRHVPHLVLENKIRRWTAFRNLTVVTPSRWLAHEAAQSRLFRQVRIEHIANAVNTDVFRPLPKAEAKRQLLGEETPCVIMTGAPNWKAKRKGFRYLLEAVRRCLRDAAFARDVAAGKTRLLAFGAKAVPPDADGIPITSLGRIDDDERLALAYSAADLFVMPSLLENLPNQMLEALACGTPVIAFAIGGIPEVVRNGETGLLVPEFNAEKMAAAILGLAGSQAQRERMAERGRRLILDMYSPRVQAEGYLRLFESLHGSEKNPQAQQLALPASLEISGDGFEVDPELFSELRPIFSGLSIAPPLFKEPHV